MDLSLVPSDLHGEPGGDILDLKLQVSLFFDLA
jgi:hypothetical protein